MNDRVAANILYRGWRNVREAGPKRLALTGIMVLVALVIARFGWGFTEDSDLPAIGPAERAMYDLRSYLVADRERIDQDQRVVLVVYDDQTLADLRKRSPLDRGMLAKALANLDTMGARAIGVDILFDQPQDEDDELVDVLRTMQTPVAIGYADVATNASSIGYDQERYLQAFLDRLVGSTSEPASVRISDNFGVTRVWPDIRADLPPVLGRRMLAQAGEGARTLPGYSGAIRYRMTTNTREIPEFTSLPIQTFVDPALNDVLRPAVEGRYVLIGGDIVDTDRVATPLTEWAGLPEPAGLQVHATMIAQMLDGRAMPRPLPVTLWAFAALFVTMAVLTGLLEWGSWRIYLLLVVQFAIMLGIPFLLAFRGVDTYGLPAVGWVVGWILAFTAVTSAARTAGAVQRNFAQGALGKYLPREMAEEIIEHPELLRLHGVKSDLCVVFSDLEGFTKMSHALEPEHVARLVNRYLSMLSKAVLDHGGVLDKFVGDAVVAFWGAPIARPDDAERASLGAYALWQAGEAFRADVAAAEPDLPPIGRTRVGLHFGEAVVGNFGGENRIQYTALGDSMNTAARLEAANKALETRMLASREIVERSNLDWWRPMGRIVLRGRSKPVEVYDVAPDWSAGDRDALGAAIALAAQDPDRAASQIYAIAGRYDADIAIDNLLRRIRTLNEEGAYVAF
ncbi:adenylate/guanylate cyclase domain-containing protein [Tsuneonella sp. YG55]|uniref:Adenylate/guanylate cyclase domain-containing protein n=1 Tax=Tsuneonella litorea TaxID=2976475 RepID=A0A9X3AK74_9SPHN|nr:adenylate/guanylate cyclase domain-containing protein [Tsuneonella litorea]MCT2557463.1 adenylate/guanylate cyclase domain-containing protein [Tsuneonella litorea]